MSAELGQGVNQESLQEMIPESLQYGPSLRSSVVTSRETIRHYPLGQQIIESRGSREVMFRLASSQFLDPKSAALTFTVKSYDKNVRGQELLALAIMKSVQLHIGGVEVESIMNVNDLCRFLIHHSVPHETYCKYENMGAWKYRKKARDYVGCGVATHTAGGGGADLNAGTLGAGALNQFNYLTSDQTKLKLGDDGALAGKEVYAPYTGRLWTEDSYRIGDDEYGSLINGQTYTLPLHLLFSFFKTKQLLPVFAMGSIDFKFSLATFEECMLVSSQFDKEVNGVIRPSRTATQVDVNAGKQTSAGVVCKVGEPIPDDGTSTGVVYICPADKKHYTVEKIYLTCQWVSCDPSYTVLLQSLISTSPSGVVIPFDSYTCVQRNFIPGSQNQILISRGLSYLRNAYFVMKPTTCSSNQYIMNDDCWYGDVFTDYRLELGSKLYNPQTIDSTTAAYYELQHALDTYGHSHQGGSIDFDTYNCRRSKYVAQVNMPNPNPEITPIAEVAQPNLDVKKGFVIGHSFEKLRGSASLTGANSRISGFNLHLSLGLKTDLIEANITDYISARHIAKQTAIQLLCYLHFDKALILSKDTISISE